MCSSSSPFHENLLSDMNLIYWDSLKSYVRLSDLNLDIGEGMCDLVASDMEQLGDQGMNFLSM